MYKGLVEFAQKRRRWILVLTGFGLTSFGAYKVYHLSYFAKKRARLVKVLTAFESVADAISDSAEMIGVVSKEFNAFLQSDSDEIPNSLNQISKIATSEEFSGSVVGVTAALTAGISRGYSQSQSEETMKIEKDTGVSHRVMDKLLSSAGSGFASVIVGSFARNLVMAFFASDENPEKRSYFEWINVACSDKSKEVVGDCIQVFVSTAVAVYLDKTMDINVYDDFFAGLTNPKHEKSVRGLLVSVCNNAIDTLVKTSHQVLTANPSSARSAMDDAAIKSAKSDMNSGLSISTLDENEDEKRKKGEKSSDHGNNLTWASSISSTLSEPANRRFILSVTGQITFETVRSFLEFSLEKASASMRTSIGVVHEAAVNRGLEAVQYFTLKSLLIATICVFLCLRAFLGGAWVLAPAESSTV